MKYYEIDNSLFKWIRNVTNSITVSKPKRGTNQNHSTEKYFRNFFLRLHFCFHLGKSTLLLFCYNLSFLCL